MILPKREGFADLACTLPDELSPDKALAGVTATPGDESQGTQAHIGVL
jgi:hypothetical protein